MHGLIEGLVAPIAARAFQKMAADVADGLTGREAHDARLPGGDANHGPQNVAVQCVVDDFAASAFGRLRSEQLADQLIARLTNEGPAHEGLLEAKAGALPVGGEPRRVAECRVRRRMDQAALRCQSWDNGANS